MKIVENLRSANVCARMRSVAAKIQSQRDDWRKWLKVIGAHEFGSIS